MTELTTPHRSRASNSPPADGHRTGIKRSRTGNAVWAILLSGLVLLALLPFVFMAVTSVQETARMTALLNPADFSLDNNVRLFGENRFARRSEEHTSELQSRGHLVCRLLLEKKK